MMDKLPLKKLQNIARRYEREVDLFGKRATIMERLKDVVENVEKGGGSSPRF